MADSERITKFYNARPQKGEMYAFSAEENYYLSQFEGTVTGVKDVLLQQPDGTYTKDTIVHLEYNPPIPLELKDKNKKKRRILDPIIDMMAHIDPYFSQLRCRPRKK